MLRAGVEPALPPVFQARSTTELTQRPDAFVRAITTQEVTSSLQ